MSVQRFIGLMSGTSLDGVDGVVLEISASSLRVLAHVALAFGEADRRELLALNEPGSNELHRAALAGLQVSRHYASVVQSLLQHTGLQTRDIAALGAHGQTVRHQPGLGYTVQLINGALLAELSGIDVVTDFRSADVAAGGQGAPLVPAFHASWFGQPGRHVALLNLGGIANLTLLGPQGSVSGFDCGPANALLDAWCLRHTGLAFDHDGAWGRQGQAHPDLLKALLAEPFFAQPAPKSTGRELFNMPWLERHLACAPPLRPVDVQATLAALTVQAASRQLLQHAPGTQTLVVCGGGAANGALMAGLMQHLPGVEVLRSDAMGLPAQQVEAAAFAWLAHRTVTRQPASLPSVTGARGARILGAVYPATLPD